MAHIYIPLFIIGFVFCVVFGNLYIQENLKQVPRLRWVAVKKIVWTIDVVASIIGFMVIIALIANALGTVTWEISCK